MGEPAVFRHLDLQFIRLKPYMVFKKDCFLPLKWAIVNLQTIAL